MATILITGGAGFIGSNFIRRHLEQAPEDRLINVDQLTYAGNLENLAGVEENDRYRFVRADIADRSALADEIDEKIDAVVHFAAESHVDRSIEDASAFLRTNVIGTQVMIDLARDWNVDRFVHVSTDEVYGTLGDDGLFTEETPLAPNSPYSASKASSDLLVRAAFETHGFPGIVTRCSNNYGPYQFPEKLIPLMISNALEDKELPIYGDGMNVRDWIWVHDHCDGIGLALQKGKPGAVYNFGGASELPNLEVVRLILERLGKPETLMRFVSDRLGHDRRYAIDFRYAQQELGFSPSVSFAEGLARTIDWYVENEAWWQRVKTGEYKKFYARMYGDR